MESICQQTHISAVVGQEDGRGNRHADPDQQQYRDGKTGGRRRMHLDLRTGDEMCRRYPVSF
jgi:hypothetical protein